MDSRMIPGNISGSTIMIVDDNASNLQIVGNLLRDEDWNLQFSLSGEKALEAVEEQPPDLILLGINMPDIDGFEVCRRLQEQGSTSLIPVIFLTAAYKDKDSIARGFEVGGVDYVTKPFYTVELKARIKTHLQLKKYQDYLEALSFTDPLTKLCNRRSMLEKIRDQVGRSRRSGEAFSLVMGDIDYFKKINDTWGHDCGDDVLRWVSQTMEGEVREQDTVSRWGGEEFLILLPKTDIQGAVSLAEKLRQVVEAGRPVCRDSEGEIPLTMTFGAAAGTGDVPVRRLISQADAALYQGKESGRNRVVSAPEKGVEAAEEGREDGRE